VKKIFQLIIGLFITQISFAQLDTVLLSVKPRLVSEYQIIYPKGNLGIRENYTFFKYRFWLGKTDTILLNKLIVTENGFKENKKRKPLTYQKYGICDSTINKIRNSSSYWKMKSEIDQIAREQIGYSNNDFNTFKYLQDNKLSDFSQKCFNEYKSEEDELREKLLMKIYSVRKTKEERFNELKKENNSINPESISTFLSTFNECSFDLKSLEIIIINEPVMFVQELEKLNDSDFFVFTLKLDKFPKGTNLSKMKESLKGENIKGSRKKKVIKKMKITKG
jgi:hypothetical protein